MKTASLLAFTVLVSACSSPPVAEPVAQAGAPVKKSSITTKSPEALTHFQRGEALLENLRTTEAVEGIEPGAEAQSGVRRPPVVSRLCHAGARSS